MAKRKTDATMIARAKQPTEKQFLSQVVEYARLKGWLVYHTHDLRHSAAGFPDLVMVRWETMIFAEMKVGKNCPTLAQEQWLDAVHSAGVAAYLWRPKDWPEIEAVLS